MAPARDRRALELGATLFFVLSGASALVYEVLWFKRFAHVWGSSSLAMASVVASFLAGLGLGARWLGARADRTPRPLFFYALCEFGIAIWALCVPWIVSACAAQASRASAALLDQPLLLTAVRCAATFVALAPACLLMGATLPLLVRWLAAHGRGVGRASAWLYASNAAGAAAGAWVAGFHLLPSVGLDGANLAAAALNAGVGVCALFLDRRSGAASVEPERAANGTAAAPLPPAGRELPAPGLSALATPPASASAPPWAAELATPRAAELAAPRAPESGAAAASAPALFVPAATAALSAPGFAPPPVGAVNLAALLTGFGSLALQMVWGREQSLLVGPTTYAFSAVVAVFIAGLAAGSLCYALLGDRLPDPRRWIALSVVLVVVGTLAGRVLEPSLARFAGSVVELRASPAVNALLCVAVSSVLELVATFAMGFAFPALIALARPAAARAGAGVGRIYAWNTLGSIAGALTALTLLVPALGSQGTVTLALAAYLLALLCVLAPDWRREWELGAAVAAAVLLIAPWRTDDPRPTNLGLYLYGDQAAERFAGDRSRLLHFQEGASANVLVLEVDAEAGQQNAPPRIKSLRVNGKVDASNWEDMAMQLGTAYIPLLLRPEARDVLVIGMGSGTTAGAALCFPATEVTCCELEPAVVEGARAFVPENKNPHGSPRFHPVLDDGRNYVQASERAFDLIISEPSNPWIAGISNLFTREFYETARTRLARGGMLVQWLQTYGLTAQQHALVVNTAQQVFPQTALVRISEFDNLLLCAHEPILQGGAALDRAQAAIDALPDVQDDLLRYFGSSDVRTLLLSLLVLDATGLRTLCSQAGDGEVNTDENLLLEFRAPRDLFGVKRDKSKMPNDAILRAFDPGYTARLIAGWGWTEPQALALRGHKRAQLARGDVNKAYALNELLLAYAPEDAAALADQLAWMPPTDAEELDAALANLLARSSTETARVAKSWLDQRQFARARIAYRALLERMPDSPTVLAGLALCQANLAEPDEARALLQRALEIDPLDTLVIDLQRAIENP